MVDFPLFPERASSLAGEVDALYLFAVGVSIFFSLLIAALLFYFFAKYRRRSESDVGSSFSASMSLEILWTVVPLVIVLVLFAWGTSVFFSLSRPPKDATEFFVTAKQWMWKIQHPEGHREINTLHVPLGESIKLTMTSEDVIHSFYVPAFRVKADVIPGRYTTVWFKATKTGTYHLFCAEYCGAEHSRMIGKVIVMEPEEYQAWLAGERPGKTLAASGEELFQALACNTCHRQDTLARGPWLGGLLGRTRELVGGGTVEADEAYIRESILNPAVRVVSGYQALMPTYQGQLSEEGITQLITYIKSLPDETESASRGAIDSSASSPIEG